MKVIALNEVIVVTPVNEKSASGFITTDDNSEHTQHGIVVSIGSKIEDSDLKVGDRIVFPRTHTWEMPVGATTYIYIKYKDLLAKIA